jgi:hypothetical protein
MKDRAPATKFKKKLLALGSNKLTTYYPTKIEKKLIAKLVLNGNIKY